MQDDLLFGKIAVKNQMLPEILIDEALEIQAKLSSQGKHKNLGEILLEKGYMTSEEVMAILQIQSKYINRERDILYGKIAIKNGLVTKTQILECVELQKTQTSTDRIGEILVRKGFISFQDHCAVLKAQSRIRDKAPQVH